MLKARFIPKARFILRTRLFFKVSFIPKTRFILQVHFSKTQENPAEQLPVPLTVGRSFGLRPLPGAGSRSSVPALCHMTAPGSPFRFRPFISACRRSVLYLSIMITRLGLLQLLPQLFCRKLELPHRLPAGIS